MTFAPGIRFANFERRWKADDFEFRKVLIRALMRALKRVLVRANVRALIRALIRALTAPSWIYHLGCAVSDASSWMQVHHVGCVILGAPCRMHRLACHILGCITAYASPWMHHRGSSMSGAAARMHQLQCSNLMTWAWRHHLGCVVVCAYRDASSCVRREGRIILDAPS